MAEFLRADIAHQMCCSVGVAIDVTVKAGSAAVGPFGAAIFGLIELLRRERRYQQSYAFQLFGIALAVEDLEEILDGDELALRDVAEIGACRQKDCGRKFREDVVGQIEVQIEAGQVPSRPSCVFTSSIGNFGKIIPPSG